MKCIESFPASLPKLVRDYLSQEPSLSGFYNYAADMDGLKEAYSQRLSSDIDREVLCDVLSEQALSSAFSSDVTKDQITRLRESSTVSITTGHQLCIYGGPLFFFYKILSVLQLAKQLKEQGIHAVPIYWMASEDHDFEEINHTYIRGKKVVWNTDQKGPVGRMKLTGIQEFRNEVKGILSGDHRYEKALRTLDDIFNEEVNLAQAIKDFVYSVFADEGLVVIDADDTRLKKLFTSHIKKELQNQFSSKAVSDVSKILENQGFKTQVNARDVNLFYMRDGYRERIERIEESWSTVDGAHQWNHDELMSHVDESPETFSPNVILRPLYQEVILPNIAYVGGPGETSYWLQLKGVFDSAGVPMPVVLLRDMFSLSETVVVKKMSQLGVSLSDLKKGESQLLKDIVRKEGTHEYIVEVRKKELETTLEDLSKEIKDFDPSLSEHVDALKSKWTSKMDVLKKKVLRKDKENDDVTKSRLETVFTAHFPNNTPQERSQNWLSFFTEGAKAIELLEFCNPLKAESKHIQLD